MRKLPHIGVRGRPLSPTRRFRGWLATWLQDRRRHRRDNADTTPVPLTVPGLKLWVRVESLNALANNAPVASWSDESGNGKHLVQATAANRPIYKSAGDGSPAVFFDGVNDVLATASPVFATNQHTIFIVARLLVTGANDLIGTGSTASGDVLMVAYLDRLRGHLWRGSNPNVLDGATMILDSAFGIFEQEADANQITVRMTGADDATVVLGGAAAGVSKPVYLGSRSAGYFMNGYVRAVLVFEGNPSAADKQRIRDYLIATYNLPVPYPLPPAPGAPTFYDVSDTGGGSAWLTWDLSTSAYATGVRIERKLASQPDSTYIQVDELPASEVEYYDPGLGAGDYSYRLRAYNGSGNSPYSDTITVTIT